MLTEQEVQHIAKLAKLKLSDAEVTKFSTQLSGILSYVDQLKEVDTSSVEPTAQVTGLTNASQTDDIINCPQSRELLQCSELPKVRGQIKVHSSFT
jgi:aspartyl-tRNA(Asn)/glutamyl-tRNA(Gln) amidotransferase subunit C